MKMEREKLLVINMGLGKRGIVVLALLVLGVLIFGGVYMFSSPERVVKNYLQDFEKTYQLDSVLYPQEVVNFLTYGQRNNLPEPSVKVYLHTKSQDKVEMIAQFYIFIYGPYGALREVHNGDLLFSLVWDKWHWDIEYINILNEMGLYTEKVKTTLGEEGGVTSENYSFIKMYRGMKYPEPSGMREYVGDEPLRIYPSSMAPYVYGDWKPQYVEVLNQVRTQKEDGMEEGTWHLVLDLTSGISGYTNSANLKKVDPEEGNYLKGDGNPVETLGGFKVGDRIETLIGLLDRDYYLIYENGRIYSFPDNQSQDLEIDPVERPFSNLHTLDAFAGYNNNYVVQLRTNSPEFPLKSGYKVGDKAKEVLNHYSGKYRPLGEEEFGYGYPEKHAFVLTEDLAVGFRIDTEELQEDSIITSIQLVKLKN